MRSRFNRTLGSVVAGLTAVIYVGLVCLAATCSLALPVPAHAAGASYLSPRMKARMAELIGEEGIARLAEQLGLRRHARRSNRSPTRRRRSPATTATSFLAATRKNRNSSASSAMAGWSGAARCRLDSRC